MRENIERIEINITREQASLIGEYLQTGEYATTDEVVREAIRYWSLQKARERKELLMRPEKSQLDPDLLDAILSPKHSEGNEANE